MLFDTRSKETSTLKNAIITSQPISGWLWAIKDFPQVSLNELQNLAWSSYQELALNILWKYDFWILKDELNEVIQNAYWNQWHNKDITPVKQMWDKNIFSLHLGYWPTFAFKNVALEFLPRLLSKLTTWKIVNVLWASSWDTINAAHSWVAGTNIRSIFMLPSNWPSEVQRLQAVNWITNNSNAITLLADMPFDPLQDIVKKVNSADFVDFKNTHNITSFNSINIARILAQIVYYFRAYTELLKNAQIKNWREVIFSVPSGNFWDALAWYYAKKMWLPISKILIATNENDMLHKFFETWVYEPPKKDGKDFVQVTNSPSMDIAKSSNFERMIFDVCEFDSLQVKWFYDELAKTWKYTIPENILAKIKETFISSTSTWEERLNAIKHFANNFNHWIDPHTAAWVVPVLKWEYDLWTWKTPVIFLETSHVAQFGAELKREWIVVPGTQEFDETLNAMRKANPREWVDFFNVSWDFEETFKVIEWIINNWPKK